ncbi:MAG: hypothetical protein ACREF0_01625 [Acetobacteraceae bacterium]
MCEVCAIFGAGEHWSDFGRLRNERYPFEDIRHYRMERARRRKLLGRLVDRLGLTIEDWDGETLVIIDRQGRQRLAPTLGDVWPAVEALVPGLRIDPLDPSLLREIEDA